MITYQVELIKDIRGELEPLLKAHYHEIAMYQEHIELSPDWDTYIQMEAIGIVHTVTVRCDGYLIGYYISFMKHNLHYSKDIYSVCDIVFVHPSYRKGVIGIRLFNRVEEEMRELGVSVMTMHVKVDHDFSSLMGRLGWDLAEKQFTKCLLK